MPLLFLASTYRCGAFLWRVEHPPLSVSHRNGSLREEVSRDCGQTCPRYFALPSPHINVSDSRSFARRNGGARVIRQGSLHVQDDTSTGGRTRCLQELCSAQNPRSRPVLRIRATTNTSEFSQPSPKTEFPEGLVCNRERSLHTILNRTCRLCRGQPRTSGVRIFSRNARICIGLLSFRRSV